MKIWKFLRRWQDRQNQWRDELESHLAMRQEWNQARGLPPDQARTAARRQFGNALLTLEEVRALHVAGWVESVRQDVRYAARGFRKSPSFSIVALSTMAIAIGSSTAVFSVVDRLLFRPLPYPNDRQLVSVGYAAPVDSVEFNIVSSYLEWRARQTPFQSITSMRPGGRCDLVAGGTPQQVACYGVEANFLRTLGVAPAAGRDFTAEEDRFGAPTVLLISDALWRTRFGANPAALGMTVNLDDRPARIVGVLPRNFEMPQLGEVDLLLTERLNTTLARAANSSSPLRTFARLRQGVSIAQARAALQPLFESALRLDVPPELRSEVRLVVRSLRDRRIEDVKAASWMLLGAVVFVLLAASANLANLLLARAASRRRELAMRAAIGAGRARLVRQLLTETLLLALGGAVSGCGAAWLLLRAFYRLAPQGLLRQDPARLDIRVLLFALSASIFSSLLFGIAPALERPRAEALTGWHTIAPARTWLRRVLVIAQVAISLIMLSGASLFLRSLWNLENQPLGFQPHHIVTASFTLRRQRYRSAAEQAAAFQELEARLHRIPGAGSFAISDSMPPGGAMMSRPYSNIRVVGRPVAANGGMVGFRWVSPGYFAALDIPILAGRDFTEHERASTATPLVLSATLARRLFGTQNAVGQLLKLDGDNGDWEPVVGVVADVKNNGIARSGDPEYYRLRENGRVLLPSNAVALFRTPLDAAALAQWLRREFAAFDPSLPISIETMDTRIARDTGRPRFVAWLITLFAAFALVLAAVGLYGVLSFLVTQQRREIGIRMALGAQPREVAWYVHRRAAAWVAVGTLAGLTGSYAAGRLIRGQLFEVAPQDPASLAAATLVLAAVAALAAWLPSRKAARLDPVAVLRQN